MDTDIIFPLRSLQDADVDTCRPIRYAYGTALWSIKAQI